MHFLFQLLIAKKTYAQFHAHQLKLKSNYALIRIPDRYVLFQNSILSHTAHEDTHTIYKCTQWNQHIHVYEWENAYCTYTNTEQINVMIYTYNTVHI